MARIWVGSLVAIGGIGQGILIHGFIVHNDIFFATGIVLTLLAIFFCLSVMFIYEKLDKMHNDIIKNNNNNSTDEKIAEGEI